MRTTSVLGAIALAFTLVNPAGAAGLLPGPATHEEMGRAIDELAGQIRGWGDRWRGHFSDEPGERPVITIMLAHREDLGLSAAQVQSLERLRAEFQREAIKRDADLRVAEMDLAALLKAEPVDMAKVEAKVRELERAKGDLRLARIRAIEQARAQLSQEQRAKLATVAGGRDTSPGTVRPARSVARSASDVLNRPSLRIPRRRAL